MAEEMVSYSKNNILQQAGQSMLAQAKSGKPGCSFFITVISL